jgi:hypothetical protein
VDQLKNPSVRSEGPSIFDSKVDIKKTLGRAQGAAMFV